MNIYWFFLWSLIGSCLCALEKAIVVVPVADLVGQPIVTLYPRHCVQDSYQNLPWSCYRSHYEANGRLHQLLFHEQATIIEKRGSEVYIEVPHVFYTSSSNPTHRACYWTQANNIFPLSSLSIKDQKKLPAPLSFRHKNSAKDPQIISLMEPWYNKDMDITFSAGTRFVKASDQTNKGTITVYALDPVQKSIRSVALPRSIICTHSNENRRKKINDFVHILRRWATNKKGFIPYVFGGCSYTELHNKNIFNVQRSSITKQSLLCYDRPIMRTIKTGFDCSGLILRAAQIAGMPYYFKNTHTLSDKLRPLSMNEVIAEGDLIWMPGHVMIISDLRNNLIIEAHSYDGGYGRVHEMPLAKTFQNISTIGQLKTTYVANKPLKRLARDGTIQKVYKDFKILKIFSLWSA